MRGNAGSRCAAVGLAVPHRSVDDEVERSPSPRAKIPCRASTSHELARSCSFQGRSRLKHGNSP